MIAEVIDPISDPGPFEMYKADSGALRFQIRFPTGTGQAAFALTSKDKPQTELYKILLGHRCTFDDVMKSDNGIKNISLPEPITAIYQEFWMTWYNGAICLGQIGSLGPFFKYKDEQIMTNNIGFIKFYTYSRSPVDWLYDTSPVTDEIIPKDFEDGTLRWERMTTDRLPQDAFIGGFENEPIYVARALHSGSMCPGKYVPSKGVAFVPWGGREHVKEQFEILCGYNAKWVKTSGTRIPQNAFIAGCSEIRNEPLYIGRALIDNNLINGKVHLAYETCYLPYKGKESMAAYYEILVSGNGIPRGIEYEKKDNLNIML